MNVRYFDSKGKVSKIELPDDIFGVTPNESVVYEYVRMYLANQRQGNASAKTKGNVHGGGAKPWRQKHTGRARQGSRRSPLWKGGGVTFPPIPRDYSYSISKKKKRIALKSALSHRAKADNILVIDEFKVDVPKTKEGERILKEIGVYKEKSLILYSGNNENFYRSFRNIPNVAIMPANLINPYIVLWAKNILFTRDGLTKFEEVIH